MDSFANVDVNYPDGQTNKTVVPAEIQARGFKPPIRTATGELEKGDNLAANHLNFILNDIYNKLGASRQIEKKSGDNQNGYVQYSNGDVEMWGIATTPASGMLVVNYPVNIPAATRDIQLTDIGELQAVGVRVGGNPTSSGFTLYASNSSGAGVVRAVFWKAIYHG